MADVKPLPVAENNIEAAASKPRYSGGRRRGGGAVANNDLDNDNGSVGRTKKPELEHYKPGAFRGTRKPEDEVGQSHETEEPVVTKSKEGRHRGNKKNNVQNNVEHVTEKVENIHLDGSGGGGNANEKIRENTNRRNRKKPEQPHYVPKKSEDKNKMSPNPDQDKQPPVVGETVKTEDMKGDNSTKNQPKSDASGGGNRKKNKGRRDNGGGKDKRNRQTEQNDTKFNSQHQGGSSKNDNSTKEQLNKPVEESQRNGHAEVNSFQSRTNNSHQNKGNNRRGNNGGGSAGHARTEDHEDQTNLPPRLRSKDENNVGGGRSDQGNRNNRNHKNRRTSPNNFNSSKVGDGGRNSSARKNSPNSNRQHQQTIHEEERRGGGGKDRDRRQFRNRDQEHFERESSSPMVSSEARSPSPGHSNGQHQQQQPQQRRDSASSRNNRRSYSPHRNIVSPTHRRGGGGGGNNSASRGGGDSRRGGGSNRRYDNYHNRDTPERRYNEDYNRDYSSSQRGSGPGKSLPPKTTMPPRFQRSRYWIKDQNSSDWRGEDHDRPRVRSEIRDYEIDDHRTFDYEKDEDDIDEALGPTKINDWGLEVEEEEERMLHLEKQQSLPDPKESARGIIRLPPDAMSGSSGTTTATTASAPGVVASGSSSSDWRAHPRDQPSSNHHFHSHHSHSHQQSSAHPPQHIMEDNNPAWRGMHNQQQQETNRNNPQQQQQRYLYDHRNPNKPIPAQNRSSGQRPPGPEVNSSATTSRFPLDPRFVPPPAVMGPRMGTGGYRPPFPVQAHPVNDPKGLASEGGEAVKIIGANEIRLMHIVQSGGPQKLCQLWHLDVLESRRTIMRTFRHLLKNNLVFCAKSDVEFYVWKICFYNLVSTLKLWLNEGTIPQSERPNVENNVIELLNEGLEFYSEMLETLDDTYHINLEQYYDVLEPRSTDTTIRCALVSAQKCLLCLGDLARYKEMIQNTSNYGKARQYYQKASHIDTRNAKPFNQLAILAWTAKRKFEAVYYHMRCLQTKSPVESSRQSLIEIFEDIRKRWEISEKKRLEERAQRKKEADSERDRMHLIKGTRLRKEVWLRPDGGRRLHRTTSAQEGAPDSEEAELKEMSTTELNRRFNNAFLHLIGTLYTHINIDAFPIGCDLLQKEFRILLSRSPLPIDCKRLVQIMALNMFIIEHTKMKSGDQEHYVSVTQNYALQLAFEMFGILVECCNNLMLSFIPNKESGSEIYQTIFNDDDLPNLLSAVKVWCDWLLGNNDTWYPVICDEPFNELAKLATHLEKLKPIITPILRQCIGEEEYLSLPPGSQLEYGMIKLDEDAVLSGYSPWSLGVSWSIYRRYAPKTIPITLLQDARRLDAINFCIDFLEGLEPPILKWSPPDNAHISLVENIGSTTADKVNAKLTHMLSREQDILDETYSDDDSKSDKKFSEMENESIDRSSKIGQLKSRKEELERRRREEEETRKLQQQILSEHVSVTLEVCPKYVVPDTNCFVDYLPEISRLVSQSPFQMRVPLVVLKELDGLAKGAARSAKYGNLEHAAMVAENARLALAFLKDRPPNTKCVTSRGTVLASLGITTEDDYDADKNNDDLILDACINLAMHKEEFQGNMRVVFRDLVLLTDDRNLKLKAHMTDIPVNKLSDFIHWAFSTSKEV